MYIFINQDFDTRALMTVSGFVMAVLIFFFNVILSIRKNEANYNFFFFLVNVSFILFFSTIVSIFITIYGNMKVAVIIISLVLFVLSFVIPTTFLLSFTITAIVSENRKKVNTIEYLLDNKYHPNIDGASLDTKQSNNPPKPSTTFKRWALASLFLGLPVLLLLRKKITGENS